MWSRYNAFLLKPPELTVAWHDEPTGARGWLVINSLRGGAAGGGTRMRIGANPREVAYLAKTMELKFALAGPPIGGAKSAIDFDPRDGRKCEVLERWYAAIRPYLRDHYGTGGDLNVDEVFEVIPVVKRLGLAHPQEGIVRGHVRPDDAAFARIMAALDAGVKAPVTGARRIGGLDLRVADLVTGYGVARAVLEYFDRTARSPDGVRVQLEGFGNVGAAAGIYLARAGARIVAVCDAERTLVAPEGLDAREVERLRVEGPDRMLPDDPRCRPRGRGDGFLDVPADVFLCAAASGTLTERTLDRLGAAGVQVIACGANQPFREGQLGSTRIHRLADDRFAVLADFLSNCGMARAFSYLMQDDARPDAAAVFGAVDATIGGAIDELLARTGRPDRGLMAGLIEVGLDRIGAP